mmetsp:Transcript_24342/g.53096  ORF Transcript_24342/g.53096 Transcript_24342/m.53096 type:complete len:1261 (+) Transcript_24342:765-4547(+)|eukprot:CAMPEP_0178476992 /NCGR_PEP_ID=MMETSP0696-20121128/3906_1 /TAXON_ID=265572 /ORGANISM="Extubocellulus spinifer, Strain CCMP396" /LENGTH=1260 /DNA_ID=CAMNT_0020104299 /DNA_START=742 /DNA_END=4524 /DNA_ORIENTATION=+
MSPNTPDRASKVRRYSSLIQSSSASTSAGRGGTGGNAGINNDTASMMAADPDPDADLMSGSRRGSPRRRTLADTAAASSATTSSGRPGRASTINVDGSTAIASRSLFGGPAMAMPVTMTTMENVDPSSPVPTIARSFLMDVVRLDFASESLVPPPPLTAAVADAPQDSHHSQGGSTSANGTATQQSWDPSPAGGGAAAAAGGAAQVLSPPRRSNRIDSTGRNRHILREMPSPPQTRTPPSGRPSRSSSSTSSPARADERSNGYQGQCPLLPPSPSCMITKMSNSTRTTRTSTGTSSTSTTTPTPTCTSTTAAGRGRRRRSKSPTPGFVLNSEMDSMEIADDFNARDARPETPDATAPGSRYVGHPSPRRRIVVTGNSASSTAASSLGLGPPITLSGPTNATTSTGATCPCTTADLSEVEMAAGRAAQALTASATANNDNVDAVAAAAVTGAISPTAGPTTSRLSSGPTSSALGGGSPPRPPALSMRRRSRSIISSNGMTIGSPFRDEVGADVADDGNGVMLPPSTRRALDMGGDDDGSGAASGHGGARTSSTSFLFGDAIMAEADDDDDDGEGSEGTKSTAKAKAKATTTTTTISSSENNYNGRTTIDTSYAGSSSGTPRMSPVPSLRVNGGGGCLFPSPSSHQSPLSFVPAQTPMRNFFDERKRILQSPAWSGPVNFNPFTPNIEEKLLAVGGPPLTSATGSPLGPGRAVYPRSDGMFGLHGGGRVRGGHYDQIVSGGHYGQIVSSSRSNSHHSGRRIRKRPPRGASPPNFAISIPTLASSPSRPGSSNSDNDGPMQNRKIRGSPLTNEKAQKRRGIDASGSAGCGREVSPTDVTTFPQTGCLSEQGPQDDGNDPILPDYYEPLKNCNADDRNSSFTSSACAFPAPPLPPSKARPAVSRFQSRSRSPARGECGSTLSPMVLVGDGSEPNSVSGGGGNNLDVSTLSQSSVVSVNLNRYENDFQEIDVLGRGSFGEVCRAISRLEGVLYAIKKIDARNDVDLSNKMKEMYALAALSDIPCDGAFHIVRYHQAWVEGGGCDPKRLYIQTELCDHTLVQEIEQGQLEAHSEERRFKLLREMCLALDVIHGNNLCHLDIKPDNIFVKDDKFKVGDFGLANAMDAGETDEGDNRYMAQEMLSFKSVDRAKCDIFSLGATMYRICLGRELPGCGDEWNDIRKGRLDELRGTHPELKRYIYAMMHPDPTIRPTAKELLQKEHLLSGQQKQLLTQQRRLKELEDKLKEAANTAPQRKPGLLQRSSSLL